MNLPPIEIRSPQLEGAEVAWFAPLCNGDDRYLGHHDIRYKSDWSNTSNVALCADRLGYRNILCPSSYQVGQDTLIFASAVAPLTTQINLLTAIRCGEVHPPMLGRAIATLDHLLRGRLTINIISSNLPGTELSSAERYQRSREVIEILKQGWTQDYIDHQGEFYQLKLDNTDPVKTYQQNGGPLLYFGGYSPPAVDLCAEHCDVYLMWPETKERLAELMQKMSQKAATYGRKVDFGLRVHVIVRETEAEARAAARELMRFIDEKKGTEIRERALDAKSYGVARQTETRSMANDEGFVEEHLWTGIGRARSGCGAAIVGNPGQVLRKIQSYMDMGIRAFIFSGYPHADECKLFAKYVLPHIPTFSMPEVQMRRPTKPPQSPLSAGPRN
ncbi:MAG TPA: LLM class flavin-dependent oxidoreductase [Saprospiraceae bacterium]|nr:LLM class flavin-dependent oxidoreductase [Saprospiraceae bacterium]